jgi:predicted Zn-dependent protease with MMP-like domain
MPLRQITSAAFEDLVTEALDGLPREFSQLLENVAVVVEAEPLQDDVLAVGLDPDRDELFGLYHGVPLMERNSEYSALPDRIAIYRGPILRYCRSRDEIIQEVRDTVIHELGHYFGLGDDEMPY